MKIKNNFILREMDAGVEGAVSVVIAVGEASEKLKGYITLNETGTYIWKKLQVGATYEEIVDALCQEYNAPREVIEKDVTNIVDNIKKIGAIDD